MYVIILSILALPINLSMQELNDLLPHFTSGIPRVSGQAKNVWQRGLLTPKFCCWETTLNFSQFFRTFRPRGEFFRCLMGFHILKINNIITTLCFVCRLAGFWEWFNSLLPLFTTSWLESFPGCSSPTAITYPQSLRGTFLFGSQFVSSWPTGMETVNSIRFCCSLIATLSCDWSIGTFFRKRKNLETAASLTPKGVIGS